MVTWKIALVVIIIAILLMLIGIWLGYRYVREQDDISPEGQLAPSQNHVVLEMRVAFSNSIPQKQDNWIDVNAILMLI